MKSLEYAIQMERDGEKYYLEQAELYKGTHLAQVFRMLARDEQEHARILERHKGKLEYSLEEGQAYPAFQSVFQNLAAFEVEIKSIPEHLDVYEQALKMEEASIKLYQEMLAEAEMRARRLFTFLVEQERQHQEVFAQVVEHLRKAEQWVESAEFGRREEY